jgi:glycosyltransferase involved in cell wall biosynthesis
MNNHMRLRIAILGTRGIPNRYGGFENLAEHLAPALVEAGHEVYVYNSHNHPFRQKVWNGVNIIHCLDPERILGSAGQFLYDLHCVLDARKREFDVILQLGYSSSSIWGRFFPSRSVIIYHMDGLEWRRTKYSERTRKFLLRAERLAVKFGNFLICDSRSIQSYLRDKFGVGSRYIAYGAEMFDEPEAETLSSYGLIPNGYYLVVARMEPENNIEIILEGFSRSARDKMIVVVGDTGNAFGRRLTARFAQDRRIRFAGAIYDSRKLYDLKFFSHLYFHGHSVGGTNPSLLEAMAANTLIAAHDNVFNREVLGQDAYYFSSSQDIAKIMDNTIRGAVEERMIRNNRRKIALQFRWEKITRRYETFIRHCVVEFREGKPRPVIVGDEQYADEENIYYRRYAE